MGMYAGVRGIVKLKPEFVSVVQEAAEDMGWEQTGHELLDNYEKNAIGLPFAPLTPLGTGMDGKSWADDGVIDLYRSQEIKEDRRWGFTASCKNKESSLYFIHTIIPYIAEDSEYLEYYYEGDDYSRLYGLLNGEIFLVEANYTFYGNPLHYPGRLNSAEMDPNEGREL